MTFTLALTRALVLAINAPDQQRADKATALAAEIASNCTPKQIAAAKRAAVKLAQA